MVQERLQPDRRSERVPQQLADAPEVAQRVLKLLLLGCILAWVSQVGQGRLSHVHTSALQSGDELSVKASKVILVAHIAQQTQEPAPAVSSGVVWCGVVWCLCTPDLANSLYTAAATLDACSCAIN